MATLLKKQAQPTVRPSEEVVTIGLYSKETSGGSFNTAILEQVDNLKKIQAKITAAARKKGKNPPKFVVSVLLIPNWEKPESGYKNKEYLTARANLFKEFNSRMIGSGFEVQDFSEKATDYEMAYMQQLKAMGSTADIIKTHAIIANAGARHLQLDSNTQISDYEDLYNQTFGATEQKDALTHDEIDALNASLYDPEAQYVSAHNKIIYTVPQSKIVAALVTPYQEYFRVHSSDDADKASNKNSIYSKVFAPALAAPKTELTKPYIPSSHSSALPTRYLANMSQLEYRITKNVVTAVNMSWSTIQGEDRFADIKKVKPLIFGDAEFNFACFANLVNVHTSHLVFHNDGGESERLLREVLHNRPQDIRMIQAYYEHLRMIAPKLLSQLVDYIPNTADGNQLCMSAFGCTVTNLQLKVEQQNLEIRQKEIENIIDPIGKKRPALELSALNNLKLELRQVNERLQKIAILLSEELKKRLQTAQHSSLLPTQGNPQQKTYLVDYGSRSSDSAFVKQTLPPKPAPIFEIPKKQESIVQQTPQLPIQIPDTRKSLEKRKEEILILLNTGRTLPQLARNKLWTEDKEIDEKLKKMPQSTPRSKL